MKIMPMEFRNQPRNPFSVWYLTSCADAWEYLHGVLYPFGEMVGYIFVGVVLLLTNSAQTAWVIYGGTAWVCLILAVSAVLRLRTTYDREMLNWRWQRRRRQSLVELGL